VLADEPRVFPDAESVEPLSVGAKVPSTRVRTIDGETVDLAKRLGERGALLVFYRGGW
jgi:peroxiredoxin